VVARELILGLRRLPGRGWRHKRQYELRFRDGSAASCSLRRLDDLLAAREVPSDFWAVVQVADEQHHSGNQDLVAWPSGRVISGSSSVGSAREVFCRKGPWIESSSGYRVRSTGRAGFEYVSDLVEVLIDSEWMATPKAVVYTRSIPIDHPEILEQVMRAWLWAGFDVDLDPPNAWT
jgi:hypothetical protein